MKMRVSQILQMVVAAVAWLVFGAMWLWAFANRGPLVHQIRDIVIVVVFSLLVVGVTLLWVHYNVGIYRRKGPRLRIPDGNRDYSKDTIGRPVMGDFSALAYERNVVISIVEGPHGPVKAYTAVAVALDGEGDAPCTLSCSA